MLNIKLEKENTVFASSFEQISVKPMLLAIALASSIIAILAVKQTNEVPSVTTMFASRVICCGKKIYSGGGQSSGTKRYFWRKDCPAGWHEV